MPVATVYPGNLKALTDLHLNREALQSAYEWAMRIMFRAPYESAQLEFDEAGKIVRWTISWLPATSDWDKKRQAYYKYKLTGNLEGQTGKWAVLNSDHSVEIFLTAGAAREHRRDPQAFIIRVDCEEDYVPGLKQQPPSIFFVGARPPESELAWDLREKYLAPQPATCQYVCGRRWMTATLQCLD